MMTNKYYIKHRKEILKKIKIYSNLIRKKHHSCKDCKKLIWKESIRCASCAIRYSYKNGTRKRISPRLGKKLTIKTKKLLSKIAIKRFENPINRLKQSRIKSKEERKKLSLSHGGTGISYERCNYPSEFYLIRESIRK